MNSTEGEETPPEVQSEADSGTHSSRTPFIVRGLVFVLLIVVADQRLFEKFFQPQPQGLLLRTVYRSWVWHITNFIASANSRRPAWMN